jgi:CrcB protein
MNTMGMGSPDNRRRLMTPTGRSSARVGAISLTSVDLHPAVTTTRGVAMNAFLTVFLSAGIGGALRHGVNISVAKLLGTGFPYGTLTVNIAGSFVIGLLVEWFALKFDPGQAWRLFLTTGILGGFTTFSAFSLDTALLIERGAHIAAGLYVLVSVVASIAGLFMGLFIVRQLA